MPASSAASRSERSLSVSAENRHGRCPAGSRPCGRTACRRPRRASPRAWRRLRSPSAAPCRRRAAACGRARARRRFPDAAGRRASASPGAVSESSTNSRPSSSIAEPPANVPTRSFGPCRSTRMPIGRPCRFSTARIAATSSRIASCEVWLMLMRKTSAPASNSRAIMAGRTRPGRASRRSWCGAAVSFGLLPAAPAGGPRGVRPRRVSAAAGRLRRPGRPVSVSCTVQDRCSPVSTSKKPVRS